MAAKKTERPSTGWEGWVWDGMNENDGISGRATGCCISQASDGRRVSHKNLEMSQAETWLLICAFKAFEKGRRGRGAGDKPFFSRDDPKRTLRAAGEEYVFVRGDQDMLIGKNGHKGVFAMKSKKAVVTLTAYGEGNTNVIGGDCAILIDRLLEAGY